MATFDRWEAVCEAYLAADELVGELVVMLAEMTSAGGEHTPTPADWGLLREVCAVRDKAEAAMVAFMRESGR